MNSLLDNAYEYWYDYLVSTITQQTSLPASTARQNFYALVRSAAAGLRSYEINLRGAKPVILMSKEELESWIETFDIMSNPEEVKAIQEGQKTNKVISHQEMKKLLGM